MNNHYIKKCSSCHKVIAQCRCADANKNVIWSVCNECLESVHMKTKVGEIEGGRP